MKEYIKRIVKLGKPEDMECLSDIMVDLLYEIKENNEYEYKKYKKKIKGMAYNYKIDAEIAKEIVENMKPYGEYWNMDTVASVVGAVDYPITDMYVVMNSLVNDYNKVINPEDAGTYVTMAKAWIDDEDAKEHKIWWYFVD